MARTTGSRSEITGPRIRDVAERLFAREGFAAVSMRRIAGEVGVQVGALYLYTPDKQTLLFELMRSHLEELLAAWEAEPRPGDPAGRLAAFVGFHIRFNVEREDAVFVAYMELRNLDQANFAAIEALRRRYESLLESILAEGRGRAIFAVEDTRVAALALIGMLTGVTTWYRSGGRLSLAEITRIYTAMAFGALGAVPPPPLVPGAGEGGPGAP